MDKGWVAYRLLFVRHVYHYLRFPSKTKGFALEGCDCGYGHWRFLCLPFPYNFIYDQDQVLQAFRSAVASESRKHGVWIMIGRLSYH